MGNWDAIVVGAGNGGLIAATRLALSGKKTLLLEKHNLPGGFATSFRRSRFEFEASLHELCGWGKNPGEGNVRKLFEELGLTDRVEWCDVPAAFRMITLSDEENIDVSIPFGLEAFLDKVEEYVPGSRESVKKVFELADNIEHAMDFTGKIPDAGFAEAVKLMPELMNFIRSAPYSVNDVLDALGVPEMAKKIFAGYWSYLGAPLNEMGFIHYISMVKSYITLGSVIPKTRSHGLSLAILDRFEECGGVSRFNSPVEEILVRDGAVYGVRLADSSVEYAPHIVCNTSPHNAYAKLIDRKEIPLSEIKKAQARQFAARGFGMFLGLNRTPQELGINEHCYLIYDTADTEKQFELMKEIDTNNVQATVCLNFADKDCSPEGTTILYFTSLFSADAWGKVKPEDYVKTKRAFGERMIDNLEKATGAHIKEHIEEIEIATPMTYARYTDAPQGVIYGYHTSLWDGVVPRTVMDASAPAAIKGLRFAGGYTVMHDGYSSAYSSGNAAAKATIADMREGE